MTARQAAELMEKEKAINDRQERVANLRRNINPLKQKLAGAVQDKRRSDITVTELGKYDESRTVYQAMGRMFVKRPVSTMKETMMKDSVSANGKIEKGKEDLNRLGELIENEENALRREVTEFTSQARSQGLTENNSSTPITQAGGKK